jgi:hypothetical protein
MRFAARTAISQIVIDCKQTLRISSP